MNCAVKGCMLMAGLFFGVSCSQPPANNDIVADNFGFAAGQFEVMTQAMRVAVENESEKSIHERAERGWSELVSPRSLDEEGRLIMVPSKDWCSGFFPGELWYMYEYTGDPKWAALARRRTLLLEREKYNAGTHDMGFKLYCSYGNAYRLTGDTMYRDVLVRAAETLSTRFNPVVGCIRSWDFSRFGWVYPVIIDNMLNLELLFWATRETGDKRFYDIAVSHARNTLKNHMRPNGSSYHVVDYDPQTGAVRGKWTHQGAHPESSWSRGQAWGLYGFTMCYRETGDTTFLKEACRIANYVFNHPNMPEDLVPYWDFDVTPSEEEPRDASAAACMASALYELSGFGTVDSARYRQWADRILENLTASYRNDPGSCSGFLLKHSTGAKLLDMEVDKPLVYADYYFLEALLRKHKSER